MWLSFLLNVIEFFTKFKNDKQHLRTAMNNLVEFLVFIMK